MTSVPVFVQPHGDLRDRPRADGGFYTRVLGFAVTDRGMLGSSFAGFLELRCEEHHQIVLAAGRPAAAGFNPINQISFRMADFGGLRKHRRLEEEGVGNFRRRRTATRFPSTSRTRKATASSFSSTRLVRGAAGARPIDMSLSDAEIWAWAERDARSRAGSCRSRVARGPQGEGWRDRADLDQELG